MICDSIEVTDGADDKKLDTWPCHRHMNDKKLQKCLPIILGQILVQRTFIDNEKNISN